MEKPKSALLDMLSVTNTAVNSIGRSPTYKESDMTSQSSSVSQDSCKESVGSTTASEVLISSTYMRKTETTESQTNKSHPQVSHGSKPSTMDEKFERLKGEKYRLLKMLSCSDYDVEEETDEAEKKRGNQHVIIENASDSIITVPGRITNTNTRITNLPQQSDNDQYFTTNVQRTKNIKNSKELSDFSSELASGASSERSEKSSSVQDDVYIQKFHLSDKEKSLKQALGKRSSQSVPVKRVIQPKYVEKTIKETVTIRKDEVDTRKNGITDENLAATVAASAAAAVAHPFFQFQKEFEEKLSKTYGKVKDTSSSPSSNDRISELEKKVSALNEQRLDHIEKLQEYQMGIQAQLLSLPCKQRPCENFQSTQQGPYENIRSDSNRNRPYELAQERPHGNMNSELAQERPDENIPSRPTQDRPHGNTSVELKPVTPVVERKSSPGRLSPVRKSPKVSAPKVNPRNRSPPRQEVKYFPVKRKDPKRKPQTVRYEEKDDSPLSTPAHRTRVPTPTAYIDDPQHKLDPRLRNGGLLEEILDRNITPQRDSTFSVPDYPRTAYNRYDYDGEKPVDQASRLLDKMIDLKHQVGRVVDTTHDPQYKNGPYPLDAYLKTPVSEILEQQTLHVNAPVFNNYGDVKKVLNTVNKKISQLESNLKHVTRIRQEDEITCLAKVLSQEGDDIQRSKITSMVDKYIRSQKKVIEGKVQAELLNAELQKQKANVEQNNKDVGKKTTVRRVPPTVPRVPPTVPRKRERTTAVNGKENQLASYKPWEKNVLPGSKVRAPPQPGTRTTTQTSNIQTRIQKQYSTHARRSSPPRSVSPSSHVIPMAVPLCNPRFLQGRTQAGVLSCEPLASSSPSTRTMMSPVANMSVVGENTMSEFNQRVLSPAMSQVSADTYDSFQQDIDQFGTGIALPGYQREKIQRPKSPPSKIASKPPILESYSQNPSSDVIATDMHRQNVLENKAFEWLQNELMGIVMSKVSTDQSMRREASLCEDHQYKYTNLNIEQEGEIQDETEEDSQLSDKSEVSSKSHQDDHNDELRKIFIDAGQPINQQLISTLVREALRERVTSFLGQANDNRPIVDQIDRKTGIEDAEVNKDEYDDDFESDSPELSVKQIPTPDLTPMSSLSDSPVQRRSPSPEVVKQPEIKKDILVTKVPEAADDSALYNSFLPAEPVQQPYPELSESEQSESYDISQELRRLAFKPGDERDGLLASLHNIETPSITPPIYSPSPPALHTLPNFTASPPPFDTLPERSPAATMTDRDDLDRTQPSLGATGTSIQFNKTQTSIDDYSNKDIKTRTKTIKVQSRSIDESLEETKKFPEHPPQPERSIKSPTRTMESSLSPVASPEPKTSSSLTDTINECISEGQWLLNRSEGQIADMPLDPGLLPMSNFNQIDISTASTLKDTDELDLDDNELLKSEGEFFHYSSVPVERDIARILDIQEQSYRQNVMNLPNTHIINTYPNQDEERHTDMSIGQVSNSRIIRVGQDPPRPSIGIIKPSKESPRKVQNYPQEFDDTPDSTMNLEELDFSKRNQQWKAPMKVKPRSSTFSMSDASLRNSHLEQSTSDAEYNQYRVRLSADSDGSVYSYEDDIDLNTAENSIPYRMSVTVPTVDPIIEDDDSDDISELHQTN